MCLKRDSPLIFRPIIRAEICLMILLLATHLYIPSITASSGPAQHTKTSSTESLQQEEAQIDLPDTYRPESEQSSTQPPILVLIVISRPEAAHERLAIRKTWGLIAAECQVKILFVFGGRFQKKMTSLQDIIEKELEEYHDVVQFSDVEDDYYLITALVLNTLNWVAQMFPQVAFVGKASDDVWINFPKVVQQLKRHSSESDFILGHFVNMTNPKNKDIYDGFLFDEDITESEVTFAVGHLWIVPMKTVPKLLERGALQSEASSSIADMIITGELRQSLDIAKIELPGFVDVWDYREITCSLLNNCSVIHGVFSRQKYSIFHADCPAHHNKAAESSR